ncbi:ABC transporter ATP-binding protein [Phyllobacterium endophyticum]|uniref:ABC transporter ATP-binding protein n=1 Tax=Phyllobacterium endophyticum TaxID=1149773 RepID=A0A2P7AS54_9HYPH|nr:sn-glycerol-3-phosphate ABC transporter ATP-binding protein UgpC [Phyllobacterium endophyticum]MBB3236773.1 lactose/L-arabinose transport system ATP-binding protein [Phyllobacterium endophyticum]PSH57049.1 ABC transporter ATP-binding protein [Phyllobacterium endophyticum]TYR40328.1 sn-glycerol-3-phosphate ABC transporter ATP-binding protein UgpC [Phyllobacterium endophyticum]
MRDSAQEKAKIELRNVRKSFGNVDVIHGLDLMIEGGEFVVFVGPSGCGKSTLLRMIAGLEDVTSGDILIADRDVTDLDPSKRGIAMVFQSYALYPHMNVRQNLSFGLEMAKTSPEEIERQVQAAAQVLKIEVLLDRRPGQLSGGQRQRVAIGRAIVRKPLAFLFDEPLSNLDAELRVSMRIEIARLHRELGNTMIYVTHDQTEAMTLADRIVVLKDGRIEQVGTPREVYEDPNSLFVAGFIGSPRMNIVDAVYMPENRLGVAEGLISLHQPLADISEGTTVKLGIRPEHLALGDRQESSLHATIDFTEYLGSTRYLYCYLPGGESITVEQRDGRDYVPGEDVWMNFDLEYLRLFSAQGERLRPVALETASAKSTKG